MINTAGEHVELFGITFSNITFVELCNHLKARIESRMAGFIVTPNVDHVCLLDRDPGFRAIYARAAFVLADGKPIIWASKLLGRPIQQKLSGSDLVPWLSAFAAENGYSIFLLGAAPGVAEEAAEVLAKRNPGLRVAGVYAPPLGFENDRDENHRVIDAVRQASPDICFVALGSPRQEKWIDTYQAETGAIIMAGVGASLDFVAGRVRRAPRVLQHCGAEWIWRIMMEPRRLWRRYLVDDMQFFPIMWREYRQQCRERAARGGVK